MPLFPLRLPGFVVGGLIASTVFFVLFFLLQVAGSFSKGSLPGAIADWASSLGPLLPWVMALISAAAGAIAAHIFFGPGAVDVGSALRYTTH